VGFFFQEFVQPPVPDLHSDQRRRLNTSSLGDNYAAEAVDRAIQLLEDGFEHREAASQAFVIQLSCNVDHFCHKIYIIDTIVDYIFYRSIRYSPQKLVQCRSRAPCASTHSQVFLGLIPYDQKSKGKFNRADTYRWSPTQLPVHGGRLKSDGTIVYMISSLPKAIWLFLPFRRFGHILRTRSHHYFRAVSRLPHPLRVKLWTRLGQLLHHRIVLAGCLVTKDLQ